jgi:hypothetical protein
MSLKPKTLKNKKTLSKRVNKSNKKKGTKKHNKKSYKKMTGGGDITVTIYNSLPIWYYNMSHRPITIFEEYKTTLTIIISTDMGLDKLRVNYINSIKEKLRAELETQPEKYDEDDIKSAITNSFRKSDSNDAELGLAFGLYIPPKAKPKIPQKEGILQNTFETIGDPSLLNFNEGDSYYNKKFSRNFLKKLIRRFPNPILILSPFIKQDFVLKKPSIRNILFPFLGGVVNNPYKNVNILNLGIFENMDMTTKPDDFRVLEWTPVSKKK